MWSDDDLEIINLNMDYGNWVFPASEVLQEFLDVEEALSKGVNKRPRWFNPVLGGGFNNSTLTPQQYINRLNMLIKRISKEMSK